MTEDQIKHMVERFLGWRLPEDFNPDAGISFKATFNDHMDPPSRNEPMGTNLFDYEQAASMVRHMAEGLPPAPSTTSTAEQGHGSFSPEGAKIPTEREVRLVLAARGVAFGEATPEAIAALDRASEAYAADVPWDNEPEDER